MERKAWAEGYDAAITRMEELAKGIVQEVGAPEEAWTRGYEAALAGIKDVMKAGDDVTVLRNRLAAMRKRNRDEFIDAAVKAKPVKAEAKSVKAKGSLKKAG